MSKHKPISRLRWQASLKKTLAKWQHKSIEAERARLERHQLPILQRYAKQLPADGAILEIGSGPVCISRQLPQQQKTYLDPLIDDFRRLFPGELPEEGEYIVGMGENINKPDQSYDLILCMDVLSYSLNPEMILNEVERLLKPDGKCIISMRTYSGLEARLHYMAMNLLPSLCKKTRPYYYTLKGIMRTLERHFHVVRRPAIKKQWVWIPFFKREQQLFICTKKQQRRASDHT